MKRVVTLLTVLLMAAFTPVCLLGCSQTQEAPIDDPGTAGGLGDALQDIGGDAMEEAADDMEDASDAMEEATDDMKDAGAAMEEAGDATEEAAQ